MTTRTTIRTILTTPMIFFAVILLSKSVIAWFVVFQEGPAYAALFKEIALILVVFVAIERFADKSKLLCYLIADLLFTIIFFAAIMYYKYYGVIVTYHALAQVNQVGTVQTSIFSLLDPYYLLMFLDIIVLVWFILKRNAALDWKRLAAAHRVNHRLLGGLFACGFLLSVVLIMPNRSSMNEIVKAEQMGILNFQLYALFEHAMPKPARADQITQEAVHRLKRIEQPDDPVMWGIAKDKNLIIIQLESLQNVVLNLEVDGTEITPTLNELARDYYYFPRFYQQVGQGNTSDAEFIVNTSYYIPPRGAATQVYGDKRLPSLPSLLQEAGYETATFHTNDVEFWNRDALYDALGFQHVYDKAYFGEEDILFFGASDEVLYPETAYALDRLADKNRPFYAHVISMSAHHPYTLPEHKQMIELPERYEGTMIGDYLTAQHYADYALGLFIAELKERGLWEDSLIVLYGDHLGLPIYSLNQDDLQLLEEIYDSEYAYPNMFNIPLIIAGGPITEAAEFTQLGGQVDILPTVANLLGLSLHDYVYFGQDLFNHDSYNLLPQRYYLPSGSFLNSSELFVPGAGYEDGERYSLSGDKQEESLATEDEFKRALALLQYSDSYVWQLPDRVN